jgi:hypothetical protein
LLQCSMTLPFAMRWMFIPPTTRNDAIGPGKIGVAPAIDHVSPGVGEALGESLIEPMKIWAAVGRRLQGALDNVESELSGPVAIRAASSGQRERLADAIDFAGAANAYYVWVPTVLALALFPRVKRRSRSALPRPQLAKTSEPVHERHEEEGSRDESADGRAVARLHPAEQDPYRIEREHRDADAQGDPRAPSWTIAPRTRLKTEMVLGPAWRTARSRPSWA